MQDIDIDVGKSFIPDKTWIQASIFSNNLIKNHPSGYYLYSIPKIYGLSAIDYKVLDRLDINKVDFLHNSVYDKFESHEEVVYYASMSPDWNLLKDYDIVKQLPHINQYYDTIQKFNITSIRELANFLSLLRPGKKHLIEQYLSISDNTIMDEEIYKAVDAYYFKKAHAYSYAKMIILQMNFLKAERNE